MTSRTAVRQLESDFADAMNRLYAVGNGLARLRAELDHEDAVGAPAASAAPSIAPGRPFGPAPGPASPPTTAAAPRPAATPPVAAPTPAWSPPGRSAPPHHSPSSANRRSPGTDARAP